MGEMADYYRDFENEFDDSEHFEGESYEKMIWTTKEGERILISDMTDSHLQNTKRMLERNNHTNLVQYQRIVEELENRGFEKIDLGNVPTHDLLQELRKRVRW